MFNLIWNRNRLILMNTFKTYNSPSYRSIHNNWRSMLNMEKQESRRRSLDRKKRKAKADASSNCNNGVQFALPSDSNFVFAVLLASICGFHEQPILLRPLIKNCLNKLCLCLKQNLPINPILSLLPTLLGSK